MSVDNLIFGMVIGAVMSIPFGAIGVVCINRIISRGRIAGLASGLGVALGDSLFAGLAIFGVAQLIDLIIQNQYWIELVGGGAIAVTGLWSLYHYHQQSQSDEPFLQNRKILRDTTTMMVMTLANPQTILGFTAAFAATVRFYSLQTTFDSMLMVVGVFVGSMLWWIFISFGLDKLRSRIKEDILYWLHQVAAMLVTMLGMIVLLHALLIRDGSATLF